MPAIFRNASRLVLALGVLATTLSFTDAVAVSLPTTEKDEVFLTAPVSDKALDESRGAAFTPTALNSNILAANSEGNVVIGGSTGSNFLGDNAINSTGLVNVIQNTGNNVIIQSSTIVNLTFNQ